MINEVISYFQKEDKKQDNFSWNEYTLEELGLPPADQILTGVKKIENIVGLTSWRTKHQTHQKYKGFGLTYNPTFFDKSENRYGQVWGSPLLDQYYGIDKGQGDHTQLENTYYDTFWF